MPADARVEVRLAAVTPMVLSFRELELMLGWAEEGRVGGRVGERELTVDEQALLFGLWRRLPAESGRNYPRVQAELERLGWIAP